MKLTDLFGREERTQDAIDRAGEAAPASWREAALLALHRLALRQDRFAAEEAWDDPVLAEHPCREPRAFGAVVQRAARLGWIVATDEFRPSRHGAGNTRPIRIWRSLLFRSPWDS